ncbi:MAG: GGDEF domain-containing protein [Gammaproteobacteria bacterium]|nr:GGDEF domain-containing protein [Gammaproteobacteria bacterium]MDH4313515.1 GGDEF domain-containing protein [Gammaproteobacteria bacterium]MDH5212584.1 GGDEF domain-containing protein [Gammaproteobacteria bacterium]
MKDLDRKVLQQVIGGSAEPMLVARIDSADWPIVLSNPAFNALARSESTLQEPLADVVEKMIGRDLALEISETIRAGQETSLAVELSGREYLMVLRSVRQSAESGNSYYAVYWRSAASSSGTDGEIHQELVKAKRRIRDLSRDDPVTGLLNEAAFREVLAHDWAVATRERSSLALVAFQLDDFAAYLEVFGRHATDSCLRRVAQAVRRCLRRASDVAARVDESTLLVLAHAASESGVAEFAEKIASAVRELGLHHPRSSKARFVTVTYQLAVTAAEGSESRAAAFLQSVLESKD